MRLTDQYGAPLPPALCPALMKPPFVCNPCKRRRSCREYDRCVYCGKTAHRRYEELLVEARTGIPLGKEAFYENDRMISEGIKRGQHLYHIIRSNPLTVSKSTIYRHLHKGYLSVAAIDFPRVVKFKPRKAALRPASPRRSGPADRMTISLRMSRKTP